MAPHLGDIQGAQGRRIPADFSFLNAASVLFDAVYVPAESRSVQALRNEADAFHFVNEAYKHCKTIGATSEGIELLRFSYVGAGSADFGKNESTGVDGVIVGKTASITKFARDFVATVAMHRHWSRESVPVPA